MSCLSNAHMAIIDEILPHNNADRLEIAMVEGTPSVVSKGEFSVGELILLIPFDVIAPSTEGIPEFIRGKRVRPAKLRGEFSMSVVLKNTWGFSLEDEVHHRMGFEKWERPEEREPGIGFKSSRPLDALNTPPGLRLSKYDLESFRKYHSNIELGTDVLISEKIDGCNSRYVHVGDTFYSSSRNYFKKDSPDDLWWTIARKYNLPNIMGEFPGWVLLGEIYGFVGGYRYGCETKEDIKFAVFDIWMNDVQAFMSYKDLAFFCIQAGLPMTPVLYEGPYLGYESCKPFGEGQSTIAAHRREGFVIRTMEEMKDRKFQRIIYKYAGEGYLISKGKLK
jgi:RNA ligase (TIGR02306 family)